MDRPPLSRVPRSFNWFLIVAMVVVLLGNLTRYLGDVRAEEQGSWILGRSGAAVVAAREEAKDSPPAPPAPPPAPAPRTGACAPSR